MFFMAVPAFAEHEATVTIDPNMTNCDVLGKTFTINVANNDTSTDEILQVEIYKALAGISDFECGAAPTGWSYLPWPGEDRCIYVTGLGSPDKIAPDEDLNFTFDASMSSDACASDFVVVTVDDAYPTGDRDTTELDVKIDCVAPDVVKTVGKPKISGLPEFDWWITQNTNINVLANDNADFAACDLGLDYCRYTYTVDGSADAGFAAECASFGGTFADPWCVFQNGPTLDFDFLFNEDSVHYVTVECYDVVGNMTSIIETDRVDDTPPETSKWFDGPQKIIQGEFGLIEWIDGVTTVNLAAVDPDPTTYDCNIGVDKTWYMNVIDLTETTCWEPDNYCNPLDFPTPYDPQGEECINWAQEYCAENWQEDQYDSWEACVEFWAHEECRVDPLWHLYDGNPINQGEESCHVMQYFSVDHLGNFEDMQTNCFFVDKTPPQITKRVGSPQVECEGDECEFLDYYITTDTDISLFCNDLEPHPSGDVTINYRYRFDEGLGWSDWTQTFSEQTEQVVFNFPETSIHELEYWCVDAVEKTSDHYFETDYVDDEPPIITKEMIGTDHLGYRDGVLNEEACPPVDDNDTCYVADNEENGVAISVEDTPANHMVDNVYCTYEVIWYNNGDPITVDSGDFSDYQEIIFTEDSTHELVISCEDALGNSVEDTETFLVDSTSPVTTKEYGEPYKVDPNCEEMCINWCEEGDDQCLGNCLHSECTWWITSQSPVTLTAEDEKVGVDEIYWRNLWFPNNDEICHVSTAQIACVTGGDFCPPTPCHPEYYSNYVDVWPEWNNYSETGPFYKPEESCHVIEYYSVDKLGNEESLNWQCVFVDNSAPDVVKELDGEVIDGYDLQAFPETDGLFHWVTQETEVIFDCVDADPHPVEQETVCYKVSFDEPEWGYITESYCSAFGGSMNDEDYCCAYVGDGEYAFNFTEDSVHDLEYYCEDHLGNTSDEGLQYYKVDDTPPVTTKTYIPEAYIDEETGAEYIDTVHQIELTATDGGEVCHVDGITTYYAYTLVDDIACWEPEACNPVDAKMDVYEGSFGIPEESCHLIQFYSEDALGNTEEMNHQCVFVDKKAPEITKEYGKPFFEELNLDPVCVEEVTDYCIEEECDVDDQECIDECVSIESQEECDYFGVEWITTHTSINISAEDPEPHPSGVKEIKTRISLVEDYACWNYDVCMETEGTGEWTMQDLEEEIVLFAPEESCHLIEITAVDNVGKTATHKQCVFVDDTAPEPVKIVGEPKGIWDGADSAYYPEIADMCWQDPFNLECWKVTLLTPVTLECVDPTPHPVNHNTVCFYVELDADDATENYCGAYGGNYNFNDDGFCCMDQTIGEFYFLEETEHNLQYYCEDALYNRGEIDDEKFKVEGTAFEIELNKKWNLVSVPFVLINDGPEDVLKDIKENVESVWGYDAEANEWYVYHPNGAPGTDNLEHIEPGWGYWIRAYEADTWIMGGSLFSPATLPPSRNLKEGWNLVGYYGADGEEGYYGPDGNGKNAQCVFYSLKEDIWDIPFSSLFSYWEPFNPNQWVTFGGWDNLDPGAGYWVMIPQDGIYSYTTDCGPFN